MFCAFIRTSVCPSVRTCMHASRLYVPRYLQYPLMHFRRTFLSPVHLGTKINWLGFEVKKPKLKTSSTRHCRRVQLYSCHSVVTVFDYAVVVTGWFDVDVLAPWRKSPASRPCGRISSSCRRARDAGHRTRCTALSRRSFQQTTRRPSHALNSRWRHLAVNLVLYSSVNSNNNIDSLDIIRYWRLSVSSAFVVGGWCSIVVRQPVLAYPALNWWLAVWPLCG